MRSYLTTAIAYVNGDPHLGYALELVQADVLARHRRLRGHDVRFLSGTDDNALKSVAAAEAAGLPVADWVAAKGDRFAELLGPLQLSYDDFIRTSMDPRHRPGVEALWRACAAAGDLYLREYDGLYCAGCEAFVDGPCDEHAEPPERVSERNWFFRLSRHRDALLELLESGRLRVEPEHRRNEALALVRSGLEDFSVSRPAERARGWGIPVPGDASQVIYVWFDALGNYLTADPARWRASHERLHVIGKGILRFHAVYWPAILRSAGEPLPTAIFVHDYLTVEGRKLSKSLGGGAGPAAVAARYGTDALRWWFLRDVPRAGDADFRDEQLAARAAELAGGLGNLVNRAIALGTPVPAEPLAAAAALAAEIDDALARFDFRAATDAVWRAVAEGNRHVEATRPWELGGDERAAVVGALHATCRAIAAELGPFLPAAAIRIGGALETRDRGLGRALFPQPRKLR